MLTEGKGDDIKEDDLEDEEEETKSGEEEPFRKKGKVIIIRPAKSSLAIFTRRANKSRKKLKLGEDGVEKIIFKRYPPTL